VASSSVGGRNADANGYQLMLADSHTAANNYGLTGSKFTNLPKNKFLFFVKFNRPSAAAGADDLRQVSFAVKNIDRPRVSFEQKTLNQYNRKRVVQTGHTFEALQLKFHDSMNPALRNMFISYYQYYYGDSKINSGSTSVYDVVRAPYRPGEWGFRPGGMAAGDNGYFFSHISVYQLYNGMVEQFDLINPKISSYNPDDFDYSVAAVTNEIQMAFDFEGIVYQEPVPISAAIIADLGIDRGLYWDVPNDLPSTATPGSANGSNEISQSLGQVAGQVAFDNIRSLLTGQGTQSLGGIVGSISGAYDANRGLAVGITGVKSIKNLISGNTQSGKQGVQGLLKGALYGKPGKLF
jgi:hypothetical protein